MENSRGAARVREDRRAPTWTRHGERPGCSTCSRTSRRRMATSPLPLWCPRDRSRASARRAASGQCQARVGSAKKENTARRRATMASLVANGGTVRVVIVESDRGQHDHTARGAHLLLSQSGQAERERPGGSSNATSRCKRLIGKFWPLLDRFPVRVTLSTCISLRLKNPCFGQPTWCRGRGHVVTTSEQPLRHS